MKLSETNNGMAFAGLLWVLYFGRLSIGGDVDDYYYAGIGNGFFESDIRVTIRKVPTEEEKQQLSEMFNLNIDELLKDFQIFHENEDTTMEENWYNQIQNSKERYEKDIARYEEKIREFFGDEADMVEYDVEHHLLKVRGYYEHPISPKLIMEFCDKFGYYMPNYQKDWINDSVFRYMHYRFHKKGKYGDLK